MDVLAQNVKELALRVKSLPAEPSIDSLIEDERAKLRDTQGDIAEAELSNMFINTLSSLLGEHPAFGELATLLFVRSLHLRTPATFSEAVAELESAKLVNSEFASIVKENSAQIDARIVDSRDEQLTFFGHKTLERGYLMKIKGRVVERPQYMFMRVALAIHGGDLDRAFETYDLMSQRYFIHATPTLFNSGSLRQQLSSCYLMQVQQDSIEGIFDTLRDCGLISKYAGGIGVAISNVRCQGSHIKTTNGTSDGIVPMLRMFNEAARYVNQAGKRNGSFAMYLEPWHPDIMDFLALRKNYGSENMRTRDLFTALWIPDLFMERVEANAEWSLMCPSECPGLTEVWGDEFKALYEKYEAEGRFIKKVPAQMIWFRMFESQIETGTPYVLFKDNVNRTSNQKHLGTIQCSNLCTEIVEYTSPEEVAVCNLASIGLPSFVLPMPTGVSAPAYFSFVLLEKVVRVMVRNLNRVIDINFYPVPQARVSNMRHRPIGIGIQGLADVFVLMGMAYDSPEAMRLNTQIFEAIYYAALSESMELAKIHGPHESFAGSPASQGILQFDMWGVKPGPAYDWDALKEQIKVHGLRNSQLVAPMPTASTSQILGFYETFEAYMSNVFKRKTLAGEFIVVNEHLVRALDEKGLWSKKIRDEITLANGSIQGIDVIPDNIKDLFKTVWEIKQRNVIDLAAARGPYICQSQSMNIYMPTADFNKLNAMFFYGWRKGLKTGMYYLRTLPAAAAQQFTVDPALARRPKVKCDGEVCTTCSS